MSKPKIDPAEALKGEEIYLVSLHQPVNWPDGGKLNTEKNMSSLSTGKTPGIKFTEYQYGILIEYKGKKCKVPYAAVANYLVK